MNRRGKINSAHRALGGEAALTSCICQRGRGR